VARSFGEKILRRSGALARSRRLAVLVASAKFEWFNAATKYELAETEAPDPTQERAAKAGSDASETDSRRSEKAARKRRRPRPRDPRGEQGYSGSREADVAQACSGQGSAGHRLSRAKRSRHQAGRVQPTSRGLSSRAQARRANRGPRARTRRAPGGADARPTPRPEAERARRAHPRVRTARTSESHRARRRVKLSRRVARLGSPSLYAPSMAFGSSTVVVVPSPWDFEDIPLLRSRSSTPRQ
jgi:hypothetical protein